MNPVDREELTLGYFANREIGLFDVSFGIRYDQIDTNGSITEHHEEEHHDEEEEHEEEEEETTNYNFDTNNLSFSIDLRRSLNENWDVNFGYSSLERAPSVVELFMNGPHLATGRFEVGNTNLATETSNNIDLGVSYANDNFFASLSFFINDVDNYVYLMDMHEEEHHDEDEDHDEEEHEEGHDDHGGLILANYLQEDAELDGYELEIGRVFNLASGDLEVSFSRDVVNGSFIKRNEYSQNESCKKYLFSRIFCK